MSKGQPAALQPEGMAHVFISDHVSFFATIGTRRGTESPAGSRAEAPQGTPSSRMQRHPSALEVRRAGAATLAGRLWDKTARCYPKKDL
jgi:hypothetical protein